MKNNSRHQNGGSGAAKSGHGPVTRYSKRGMLTLNALVAIVALGVVGKSSADVDVPSSLPVSPLFGAQSFAQQMLRFEEFAVLPLPPAGAEPSVDFTPPSACDGRPGVSAMEDLLLAPLWPDPTVQANTSLDNPWAAMIDACIPGAVPTGGVAEGRPPGVSFSHQRWDEFPPQVYFQSAMGGARTNTGFRNDTQSHGYAFGEFAEDGLYHNTTGANGGGSDGTTNGIEIRFHPSMPIQDPETLWTFGDGTLPPKLLPARYGVPILFRHYNALPISVTANGGFGEHTVTTHEHNGHNPGEVDGFAGAYFFPGEFYDYRWPMVLAGHDSINADARDPRASTPCSDGEVLMIADPHTGTPVAKTCDPDTLTVNIPGDWREIMSTHWFHDHMIDRTSENVYKGNAAMMNYYSGIDRGKEGFLCDYDDTPEQDNVNLCFPSGTALDWGNRDYDVQLLIAAKAWGTEAQNGQLHMAGGLNEDGFLGDRMTVNWLYEPYLDVRPRKYRFRILNGAVARFFKFAIVEQVSGNDGALPGPDGSNVSYNRINYHLIANDGNIMEHAIPFGLGNPNGVDPDLPVQGIAERFDIIVDFSQFSPGSRLYMVNTLAFDNGRGPKEVIPLAEILDGTFAPVADLDPACLDTCWSDDPVVKRFLEFRVQTPAPGAGPDLSMDPNLYAPVAMGGGGKTMVSLVQFTQAELDGAIHRTFDFSRGAFPNNATDGRPSPWGIVTDDELVADTTDCVADPGELECTRAANLNRVSAAPETIGGGVEIWHIRNGGGGWGHPVHIHFEEGQYLDRDGAIPPPWEVGARKDMYRVSGLNDPSSSSNISVAIRFREFAGTYVEHCHNTTHEDKAMLLRWDNEVPGQTVRIPTPLPTWDGVGYISAANPDVFGDTAVLELATIKTGNVAVAAASDLDGDGILDSLDNCVIIPNPGQEDVQDIDGPDGVGDACDNCRLLANTDQLDTNADGFGNACDADFNGDGVVNLSDFSAFRASFGTNMDDADFNGDGVVDLSDFSIFRANFGGAPGPSASNP